MKFKEGDYIVTIYPGGENYSGCVKKVSGSGITYDVLWVGNTRTTRHLGEYLEHYFEIDKKEMRKRCIEKIL